MLNEEQQQYALHMLQDGYDAGNTAYFCGAEESEIRELAAESGIELDESGMMKDRQDEETPSAGSASAVKDSDMYDADAQFAEAAADTGTDTEQSDKSTEKPDEKKISPAGVAEGSSKAAPLIWAHRGASGYMPENTLEAFRRAADLGADGVELDIQLTRDGQIVVCHDETIDRTSNGTGYIKDYSLKELRQFNFNKTHPEIEHVDIPTMKEVFELLGPTGLTINIELKTGLFDYDGIEQKIIDLTHEMNFENRVIYSSFNHYSIERIQKLDPSARTAFLYSDGTIDMPAYGALHHVDALHPWVANLRYPNYMEECRKRGLEVNVWTANTREDIIACRDAGVHAIITNYPDYARTLIEGHKEESPFQVYIRTVVKPWLASQVVSEDIFNSDGIRLRVYSAVNPQEKASIVMVHGFCEFFGKYHETACRLYREGYSIFFVEMRGHGDSGRSTVYHDDRVGVKSFDEYISDVNACVEQVVLRRSKTRKLYLFSHSMGGCVSALYMEKYPRVFRCAVLSSPMLKIDYRGIPDPAVNILKVYSDVKKNDDEYAPKNGPFNPSPDLENSCAMDEDRYMYQFCQRLENKNYQTNGGTWGWCKASLAAQEEAIRHAGRIRADLLLCQAGADNMVDNAGQFDFLKNTHRAMLIQYPKAKHEIYNATDKIRTKWFADIIRFYHSFD